MLYKKINSLPDIKTLIFSVLFLLFNLSQLSAKVLIENEKTFHIRSDQGMVPGIDKNITDSLLSSQENELAIKLDTLPNLSASQLYKMGWNDAKKHYKGYGLAAAATLLTETFSYAGILVAIITASVPPKQENLGYPNETLIQNPAYYKGYTQRAKRIKQRWVWFSWAIPFIMKALLLYFLIFGILDSIY